MEFALVRFPNEGDAPGIISSRWIDSTNNSCWFPNVVAEGSRKRLVIAHATPEKDWLKCPIKLLGKFSSYNSARNLLRETEEFAIFELWAETLGPCKRTREIRPGEEASSGDESKEEGGGETEEFKGELCIKSEPHSPPPTSTSTSSPLSPRLPSCSSSLPCNREELPVYQSNDISNLTSTSRSSTVSTPAISCIQASCDSATSLLRDAGSVSNLDFEAECLGPSKKKRRIIRLPSEKSFSDDESKEMCIKSEPHSPPPTSTFLSQTPLISSSTSLAWNHEELPVNQSNDFSNLNSIFPSSTCSAAASSHIQELSNKMDTISNNQRIMWQAMQNLAEIFKRIEQKLDSLTTNCNYQVESSTTQDEEELTLISSLPLGVEDFEKLEEKILSNCNTKKWLVNICMTVDGREPKILASNLMRKFFLDDVGLKYSLTGKSVRKDVTKKCFEETKLYKLIEEMCLRNFKDARLNVVREAVSDWLMQAKFRKSRREQRSSDRYDVVLIDKVFNDL